MYCLAKRRDWWLVVLVYVIFIVGSPRSADCQRQEHGKPPSFTSTGSITKGEEGRREGEEKKRTVAIRPQGTLSIVEPRQHGIVDCERVYITGVLLDQLHLLTKYSEFALSYTTGLRASIRRSTTGTGGRQPFVCNLCGRLSLCPLHSDARYLSCTNSTT